MGSSLAEEIESVLQFQSLASSCSKRHYRPESEKRKPIISLVEEIIIELLKWINSLIEPSEMYIMVIRCFGIQGISISF